MDELTEGVRAATEYINLKVPRWARGMISDSDIREMVANVIDATANVRKAAQPEIPFPPQNQGAISV